MIDSTASIIRVSGLPIIIIIGAMFNLLSFVVMRRVGITTFSMYMSVLAVVDTSM